jgi:hypothetical protein
MTRIDASAPTLEGINWVAGECLPRDREPSRRLHEPAGLLGTIDPITGRDIGELSGRPYVVEGNLVAYFESEATRQDYLDMPLDHPFRLQDNPLDEWVAHG